VRALHRERASVGHTQADCYGETENASALREVKQGFQSTAPKRPKRIRSLAFLRSLLTELSKQFCTPFPVSMKSPLSSLSGSSRRRGLPPSRHNLSTPSKGLFLGYEFNDFLKLSFECRGIFPLGGVEKRNKHRRKKKHLSLVLGEGGTFSIFSIYDQVGLVGGPSEEV